MDLVIVLFATLLAALTAAFLWLEQNRRHITKNWVSYRCNPLVMPFASFFGKDTASNFQYCLMNSTNSYLGYVFSPIYYMFSVVGSILADVVKSIDDIRTMLTSVRGGFLGIVGTIVNKVENVAGETVVLVSKLRDILSRMAATMTVMATIGFTTADTGSSLMNGPVGEVIDYFCFPAGTPVNMPHGRLAPIESLVLGDILANGARVTSVMQFAGANTRLFRLDGVVVSGNHRVQADDGRMIRVDAHPRRKLYTGPAPDVLYCLNTSMHTIPIGSHIFSDFEESDAPAFVRKAQALIAQESGNDSPDLVTGSYETGFAANTRVLCAQATMKPICELQLGDLLVDNAVVTGLALHAADPDDWRLHNGVYSLKDTALGHQGLLLFRAARSIRSQKAMHPGPAYHVTTSSGRIYLANGFFALDDQESYVPRTNQLRDAALA